MRHSALTAGIVAGLLLAGQGCTQQIDRSKDGGGAAAARTEDHAGWTDRFDVPKANFASTGRSAYFVLEPGFQAVYEGKEDGKRTRLVITVTDDTKTVDGVETRIVEEREWSDGKLVEVSRNYFAIDTATKDVYYFGEDVDMYKNGKVADHGGSWQSGVKGARYGLAMPGSPKVGQKYYQELAPDQAMDRVENVSLTVTRKTPAGEFKNCLKTEETSPLEPGNKEYKVYAPGVGLIADGTLPLVKYDPGAAGKQ